MIVRMLENRRVGGVIYTSGTSYDVSDDLGALLVGGGWAVRTDAFIRSGNQLEAALDASGNMVGVVGPGGVVPIGMSPISSVGYASGQVVSYVESGVSYAVGYDGQGRVSTVSGAGLTRTVTYNPDGTVASFA